MPPPLDFADAPAPPRLPLAGEATLRASLGTVQGLLDRPAVTEVCCNAPFTLDVEEAGRWRREPAPDLTPDRVSNIAVLAGALTGQDVSARKPVCYTVLPNEERLTIAVPPAIRPGRACLVVRRREKLKRSFDAICDGGMFDEAVPAGAGLQPVDAALLDLFHAKRWREFFKLAMRARKNIVLAGKPGSGKTTLMEAMIGLIPLDWRLVTIESTPELELAHQNAVQLYYSKGGLGLADIGADELAELVLRLYPTLTLFGELVDRAALPYMRVVAAGNPGLTTLHANSVSHVFQVLALQMRQHPSASHLDMETLGGWIRDTVDIAAHFERRKVELPDGSVREAFRCTEVRFKAAEARPGSGQGHHPAA